MNSPLKYGRYIAATRGLKPRENYIRSAIGSRHREERPGAWSAIKVEGL